jgi:predicted nucleic acid-binding protein
MLKRSLMFGTIRLEVGSVAGYTSIVVALLRGDLAISEQVGKAEDVFINTVVLGELYGS